MPLAALRIRDAGPWPGRPDRVDPRSRKRQYRTGSGDTCMRRRDLTINGGSVPVRAGEPCTRHREVPLNSRAQARAACVGPIAQACAAKARRRAKADAKGSPGGRVPSLGGQQRADRSCRHRSCRQNACASRPPSRMDVSKRLGAPVRPAADAPPGPLGEQPLDQVQPRRARRREVHVEAGPLGQPVADQRRLVRPVVVHHHVHVEAGGDGGVDRVGERAEPRPSGGGGAAGRRPRWSPRSGPRTATWSRREPSRRTAGRARA